MIFDDLIQNIQNKKHSVRSAFRFSYPFCLGDLRDHQACIAGGIAEAYYKEIPKHISDFCDRKIDYTLKKVVLDFKDKYCEIL